LRRARFAVAAPLFGKAVSAQKRSHRLLCIWFKPAVTCFVLFPAMDPGSSDEIQPDRTGSSELVETS